MMNRKIIAYELVSFGLVGEYIQEGWQPWGSPVQHGDYGAGQAMVRYED
jgi:hypothetical protein